MSREIPSMLLNEQKGVSIWRNERPFFKQASSTEGVERTITTGVISSNSICPSGVLAGSIVVVLWCVLRLLLAAKRLILWWGGYQIGSLASERRLRFGNQSPERGNRFTLPSTTSFLSSRLLDETDWTNVLCSANLQWLLHKRLFFLGFRIFLWNIPFFWQNIVCFIFIFK